MMNLIERGDSRMRPEGFGADLPMTSEERFVKAVYSSVDEAIACRLDLLRREDGIVPTCKPGCSHCCRYHILTSSAEVHTLAQYVKRELSREQIRELRMRTKRWHEWDDTLRGRTRSAGMADRTDASRYEPCCPVLIDGVCGAYGVRPVVCRTHFVSSHPQCCHAANDPESAEDPPLAIGSVVTVTSPYSMEIRRYIEKAGMDYHRSMTLLPHGLAMEMGWDFAIPA